MHVQAHVYLRNMLCTLSTYFEVSASRSKSPDAGMSPAHSAPAPSQSAPLPAARPPIPSRAAPLAALVWRREGHSGAGVRVKPASKRVVDVGEGGPRGPCYTDPAARIVGFTRPVLPPGVRWGSRAWRDRPGRPFRLLSCFTMLKVH